MPEKYYTLDLGICLIEHKHSGLTPSTKFLLKYLVNNDEIEVTKLARFLRHPTVDIDTTISKLRVNHDWVPIQRQMYCALPKAEYAAAKDILRAVGLGTSEEMTYLAGNMIRDTDDEDYVWEQHSPFELRMPGEEVEPLALPPASSNDDREPEDDIETLARPAALPAATAKKDDETSTGGDQTTSLSGLFEWMKK